MRARIMKIQYISIRHNGEGPAITGKPPKLILLPTEAWTNADWMSPKPLRTINSPHISYNALPLNGAKEGISVFQRSKPAPHAASYTGARPSCYQSQQEFCHSFPQKSLGFDPIFLAADVWKKYWNMNLFHPEVQDGKIISCIWLTP